MRRGSSLRQARRPGLRRFGWSRGDALEEGVIRVESRVEVGADVELEGGGKAKVQVLDECLLEKRSKGRATKRGDQCTKWGVQ